MTFTSHIAVGCAVGVATRNPTLGFFAGWASHHLIDSIPHSDPGSFGANVYNVLKNRKATLWLIGDVVFGATLFLILFCKMDFPPYLAMAAMGAILPDLVDNSPFWSPALRKYSPFKQFHWFHEKVHFTIRSGEYFWWGVATQTLLIVASIVLIMVKLM
jgi:hypothetical protein